MEQLEELTLCNCCKQKFNDSDHCPKFLGCRHHFCLRCVKTVLTKDGILRCIHCWKATPLNQAEELQTYNAVLALANNFTALNLQVPDNDGDNCPMHGLPLTLWCCPCGSSLCHSCVSTAHARHPVKSHSDAKQELLTLAKQEFNDTRKTLFDIRRLASKQRDFLLRVLEACVTLKTHVELDLQNGQDVAAALCEPQVDGVRTPAQAQLLYNKLVAEKQKLQSRHQEMSLQCQLDDLICNSTVMFDFDSIKQSLGLIHTGSADETGTANSDPVLFLANYCMSQLYSRHMYQSTAGNLFFFVIAVEGNKLGRVVIETQPAAAPRMAHNFSTLTQSASYKGCLVFQCWQGESVITGDYECNNGRGGKSIYEGGCFEPDATKLPAVRGAVGMRRSQKRYDRKGTVGSQFRIILREMTGITGIFGHVVEGLSLVQDISMMGDATGKPTKAITIEQCGKL